jgi:hypothetical protein
MVAWLGLQVPGLADTFKLTNGETVTGEVLTASASDTGIQIKIEEGRYERVAWNSFSQEDLKKFATNPKLSPLVEPFIEISQEEKLQKTAVPNAKQPDRLALPAHGSLFGALFSSGLGVLIVLLLYGANLYAAYEISIFRARPTALVCGVSAVAPVIGPIIFVSMPTKIQPAEPTWDTGAEQAGGAAAGAGGEADTVNPMQDASVQHPAGLKLHTEAAPAAPAQPPATVFQRGQYTFNRRFIETKFAGFFPVVRHGAEKDMVLVIKASRGQYVAERISRIAANDFHVQVHKGHASEEVMIPFVEIQEIQIKPKDAP